MHRAAVMLARVGLAACAALGAAAPAAAAPAPLSLGIQDPYAFQGELGPEERALALRRARDAGSTTVRLGLSWRYTAMSKPPDSATARNPNWPGYRWNDIDAEVRAVLAAGMQPVVVAGIAPEWAEGPNRPEVGDPPRSPAGTWRPSPRAFADFGRALAARYSGRTSDAAGAPLPRVRYYQAWNQPNLTQFLAPQAKGVAVRDYRSMLRAFNAAVKAVRSDNFVLTAGLAPYGDHSGTENLGRTPPVPFARSLLCSHPPRRCKRLPFDAFALHLFPLADPRKRPRNAGDIRGSVGEVTSALRRAARAGTISSRQARTIWLTELGWAGGDAKDSVTYEQQARFLQINLYTLWREGVDHVQWYNLRDRAQPGFTQDMGLFRRGPTVEADTPKPVLTAYRFPFVVVRSGRRVVVWGRAPRGAGPVIVERADGGAWREVARVTPGSRRVFLRSIRNPGKRQLRARQGSDTSLASRVTTAAR